GFIFVFGGQVGYSTDCKCFRTIDTVLVFNVTHANTKGDTAGSTSVVNGTGTALGAPDANASNDTEVVVQVEKNTSITDLSNATETDAHDHDVMYASIEACEAWYYLPVALPSHASAMGISLASMNDTKRIVLTGGCVSELGTELVVFEEFKVFECVSLSNKCCSIGTLPSLLGHHSTGSLVENLTQYLDCHIIPTSPYQTYAFDPIRQSESWTSNFSELAEMPRTRNRRASAIVGGKVCVFGGRDETDLIIPEVGCYDMESNERLTSDHAAVAMEENLVYLIWGYTQDYTALEQVTAIDMTDPIDPTYADGPPLKSTRG
ncbi:hypothetical protein ACHAWF_001166, partial [Thalassiosira exigua]